MSTSATFNPEVDELTATMTSVAADIGRLSDQEALRCVNTFRSLLDSVETDVLARHVPSHHIDGPDPGLRRAKQIQRPDRGTSQADKHRALKRARAVNTNPELGDMQRSGVLSTGQLDVVADASSKSSGDAATDPQLINKLAAVPPDQGRKIVREWLADRATASEVNAEHERQKRLRRASCRRTQSGLKAITLEGPTAEIDQLWADAEKLADTYYQQDGGRDLPTHKHPRTRDQRLYDATLAIVRGTACPSDTANLADLITSDTEADPAETTNGRAHSPSSAGRVRPAAVIGIPLERLTGLDAEHALHIAGRGPIPDEIALQLLQNCDLYVQITSQTGTKLKPEPLWQGRLRRNASIGQFIALAIRDGGCVTCNAPPEKCHAHHLVPWHAPAQGETDVDQLALQCEHCHRELHHNQRTLVQQPDGTWITRPATADELPPAGYRGHHRQRSKPNTS